MNSLYSSTTKSNTINAGLIITVHGDNLFCEFILTGIIAANSIQNGFNEIHISEGRIKEMKVSTKKNQVKCNLVCFYKRNYIKQPFKTEQTILKG
jgi:hypothetical protein